MQLHTQKLNDYLADHIPVSDNLDIHSTLEFLYASYMEWNPIHTEEIKSYFNDLEIVMDALSHSHADLLFHKVCALCGAFEKEAFIDGLYMGAKLAAELIILDKHHSSP